jgi:TP901 family phage tail tape measure protein
VTKDAEIKVGVGLDIQQAVKSVEALVEGFKDNLDILARNEAAVKRLQKELTKLVELQKDKPGGKKVLSKQAEARRIVDFGLTAGNYTSDQISARAMKAAAAQQERVLSTTTQAITARLNKFEETLNRMIDQYSSQAAATIRRNQRGLQDNQQAFTYGSNVQGTQRRQALQQELMRRSTEADALAFRDAQDRTARALQRSRPVDQTMADTAFNSLLRRNQRSMRNAEKLGLSESDITQTFNRGGAGALDKLAKEQLVVASFQKEQSRLDAEAFAVRRAAIRAEAAGVQQSTIAQLSNFKSLNELKLATDAAVRQRAKMTAEEKQRFDLKTAALSAEKAGLSKGAIDGFLSTQDLRGMRLATSEANSFVSAIKQQIKLDNEAFAVRRAAIRAEAAGVQQSTIAQLSNYKSLNELRLATDAAVRQRAKMTADERREFELKIGALRAERAGVSKGAIDGFRNTQDLRGMRLATIEASAFTAAVKQQIQLDNEAFAVRRAAIKAEAAGVQQSTIAQLSNFKSLNELRLATEAAARQRAKMTADEKREFDLKIASLRAERAGVSKGAIEGFVGSQDLRGMRLATAQANADRQPPPPQGFGGRLARRFETATDYLAIGSGLGMGASALNEVLKFDDALARFAGITETSNKEMVGFRSTLLTVAQTARASVSELAEVAIVLGQTGLSAADVTKALKPIAQLSLASGATLKETADVVTGVLGAFQIDASRTTEIANLMAASLNQTKLTMQQLALGIQYAGNIANDAGMTFTELTAVLGTLSNAGIRAGSTLGTGTRQLIQDLISPSDKLKTLMQQLGITMGDIDVKTNGLVGVLENLRAKGFGTAEALATLDLRAAAAFSALASRTEQTKRLQEVLLLTEASTTASARASESFLATMQRLGNSLISFLDSAFRPFGEALKVIADIAAGAVNGLNSLIQPLGAVGQSAVILGGAVGGILALRTGLAALGATAAATATGVGALSTAGALAFGPVGWVIAGASALAALGFSTMIFGNNAGATAKKLDDLAASLNEVKSRESTLQTTLSSLDRAIDQALTRADKLRTEPVQLRAMVVENQKAFAQFGLSLDSGTAKIEDLVAALRALRNEVSGDLSGLSARQVNLGERRLETLRAEYDQKFKGVGLQAQNLIRGPGVVPSFFGGRNVGPDLFEGRLAGVQEALNKPRSLLNTDGQARAGELLGLLNRERTSLTKQIDATTPDSREAKRLTDLRDRADKLFDLLNDLLIKSQGILGQTKSTELQLSNQSANEIRQQFLTRDRGADTLSSSSRALGADDITNLEKGLSRDLTKLVSKPNQSNKELLEGYRTIKAQAVVEAQRLSQGLEEFALEMRGQGRSDADIKIALTEYRDRLTSILNLSNETVRNATETMKSIETIQDRGELRTLQSQSALAKKKLGQATDQAQVDKLSEEIIGLAEKEHEINKRLKMRELKNVDRNISQAERNEELAKLEAQRADDVAEARIATQRRSAEIATAQIESMQRRLKAQIDETQAQIEAAERQAKDPGTTRDQAAKLFERIRELIAQKLGLERQTIENEAAKSFLTPNNIGTSISLAAGSKPSAAALPGTVARQIIDGLAARGRPDLIPYALMTGQRESGLDPSAQNRNASGLFQFMPDTTRGLGFDPATIKEMDNQLSAFVKLTDQIDQTLRTAFPGRSISDSDRRMGHHFGTGAAVKILGSNDDRRIDDILGPRVFQQNRDIKSDWTVADLKRYISQQVQTGGSQTSRFLDRGDMTLGQQQASENAEAEQRAAGRRARTAEEKARQDERDAKFRADQRAGRLTEDGINSSIRSERAIQTQNPDPKQVADSLLRVVEQGKALYDLRTKLETANPANTSNPLAVKDVQRRSLDELQQNVEQGLDRMAKAARDKIDAQVRTLENTLAADQLNPSLKAGERASLEEQLRQLKLLQSTQVEYNSAKEQLRVLDQIILDLSQKQGVSMADLNVLTERQKLLKSQIAQLAPASAVGQRAPDYSFGAAFGNVFKAKTDLEQYKDTISDLQSIRTSAIDGLGKSLFDIATNAKSAGEAFKQFGISMLQTVGQILAKRISEQLVDSIFGAFGKTAAGASPLSGLSGKLGSMMPTKMAQGGFVRAAQGFNVPNRDSVPILAMPGEMVLRKSTVDSLGRENLQEINALGNRVVSRGIQRQEEETQPSGAGVVNVWVVSPDQVPPPGPRDIVTTIGENIMSGGTIKQLIKQVQVGTV